MARGDELDRGRRQAARGRRTAARGLVPGLGSLLLLGLAPAEVLGSPAGDVRVESPPTGRTGPAAAREDAPAERGGAAPVVDETDVVSAYLAGTAAAERQELLAALREAAGLARVSAPSWSVEALREESTDRTTAFTTEVLSVGLGLELSRRNAVERRRAASALAAEELALEAELVEAVSDLRQLISSAWAAGRQADVLGSWQARIDTLLEELERLVVAGEHARFDVDRLRSVASTHAQRVRIAAAEARAARARLSALTGLDVSDVSLEESAGAGLREAALDETSLRADIVERTLERHPILEELRRRLASEEAAVDLAGRSHPGTLDLRGGYRRDDEPGTSPGSGYEVEVAYTLPSRPLRRHAEARARARRSSRRLALARAEIRVAAEVEASLARLSALEAAGVGEDGDPEALREGAVRRYRAGESTLTELADVLVGLEERALQALQAETALRRARVELDRATGLVTAPELSRLVEETTR